MQSNSEPQLTEEQKKQQALFAQLQKLKLVDIDLYPYRTQEKIIGKYKREHLKKAMEAPELEANQRMLRNISKFLYNASSHYKRLILYFSEVLTLDHYVEPYGLGEVEKINKKKLLKAYQDTINLVEKMNIKHEFGKVLQYIFKEGVYFGYIHQNKDSFFLQPLDADYTKITYIEDGLYGLSFDFSYFMTYPERLNFYPDEFRRIYNEKYSGKKKTRGKSNYWEELSSENTITIKFDETVWYSIPPFIGIFDSLLDISDFKDLAKTKEEIQNYKLITMKIPINEQSDGANNYSITADHVQVFQDNVASVVPEQIGVASIPMEVDVVDFETDRVDKNKVSQATDQYFSEAGVSKLLFSSDSSGSVGLDASVKVDESLMFGLLRQIERWINKFLKNTNGQFKFRITMPDITWQNRDKFIENNLKLSSFGVPNKLQLIAASGQKPSGATTMTWFENEVLDLPNKLIPLVSSHTQAGLSDGGRPQKDKVNENGEKQRDNGANANRAK